MDNRSSLLYILTGGSGTGKTRFCRTLAESARALGWDVAGVISPPLMDGARKTGILAEDIRAGEQQLLGRQKGLGTVPLPFRPAISIGQWLFDPRTLDWANQVVAAAPPCDLLIVDELGPLEFRHGEGLMAAFDVISQRQYRLAVVVIRPELVAAAHSRWRWGQVLSIENTAATGDILTGIPFP